ncbi:Acetylornithine deacetylase/Succinyl-diaminopimelate desuccinylase [Streptosporangium subroseum]|uniref:Acetylornithine deacetylase/Succinyl-diaminopimelate desuccinylase n=1 Tax=Streptosporangium subroseum TaxID=106412 RepID=A0A239MKN9_9ACTN|nr:M20/M25/M40 family metallo-hydrolase [Streptosporangium subroseum]SNT42692.1 Acetylornithine deacetylase/Succinyl-diaminopimelate desuccinylase [Streptosporangium subroseum]
MDYGKVREAVIKDWDGDVLPSLSGLVEIPALSAAYDAAWERNGHLRAAADHVRDWIASRGLPGAQCEVFQLDGRAPLLLVDVPATTGAEARGTVLLYGHLDKQPPLGDWSDGLGPWQPVVRDGRLYGRGAVDDGYSGYAATTALAAVQAAGGEHARAILLLETGEESGSPDLPAYLEHLSDRLGEVSLVVCLDAGGGDYERMWLTASLRGVVQATVTVRVLETSAHSGLASGIVPSSFRVMRRLLDRVEDSVTGEVTVPEMNVPIPEERRAEAEALAALEPGAAARRYRLADGMRAASDDDVELILNNTWRPTLSVIGAAGLPDPAVAGAVLRASTSLRLSFRTPPTVDAEAARAALVKILTTEVPYGAQVEVGDFMLLNGWQAPATAPWLAATLEEIGDQVFGEPCRSLGIGGGIPFMEMLGRRYPDAQFVVTGALGADSNMHVPDEWLNIAFAGQVTEAVAHILDAHARN